MSARKEILLDFLDQVWSRGDAAQSATFVAPSYTIYHDPGDPWDGHTLNPEQFINRVERSRAPFPDQRFDVEGLFEDGNAIVATWNWSATHRGDIPGFPATGRQVTMSGATVYYFDGNSLRGHWQIVDRLGVFQQLQRSAADR